MEVSHEVERAEFETITDRLVRRASTGRGRVTAVGRGDAEDVVQDAWEKRVRQGTPLPRGRNLEAHLHEALVDVSTDHRRSRRRKSVVPAEKIVQLETVPEDDLGLVDPHERHLAALQARELYETALEVLGEAAMAYAVLDALDLSEKEIAVELGISEREASALRKRVSRARPRIAEAIGRPTKTEKEDH
jgi:DNA-directed RNA polymerase specialized sigma24 family protein